MSKEDLKPLVRAFQQLLDRHEQWLEKDYLRRQGHTAAELALAQSALRYIVASRRYSAGEKIRSAELQRRKLKLDQTCSALAIRWFEKGRS